ncbi:MAG: rhodanese-like domain-containing protein [Pseudomonadota bacterium]
MMRILLAGLLTLGLGTGLLGALPAQATGWSKLIGPGALEALMAGPEAPVLLDIRSPKDFAAAHLPGAANAPYGRWRGPRENPGALIDDDRLTALLQGAGIGTDRAVVVMSWGRSETDFGAAARVYWTLKSAGLGRIAILNGGVASWQAAGGALTAARAAPEPGTERFALGEGWLIDRAGVQAVIDGEREAILVDARPEAFFRGETKHGAAHWAGSLEGAINLVHDAFFAEKGRLIAEPAEIRRIAAEAGWRTDGPPLVSFCNTGHWAATNWFALSEIGGIPDVRLYPESMVGWTRAAAAAAR